jgi:hypothetical protein
MRKAQLAAFLLAGLAFAGPAAQAFVFRIGDTVYVDGKRYSWEEWKKIRDHYQPQAPAAQSAEQVAATAKPAAPPLAADAPRAASCSTTEDHDEFPADNERFSCSAGLGALTREELLRQGWKIDLVEKIPAAEGRRSARGLPLFRYKLVVSR